MGNPHRGFVEVSILGSERELRFGLTGLSHVEKQFKAKSLNEVLQKVGNMTTDVAIDLLKRLCAREADLEDIKKAIADDQIDNPAEVIRAIQKAVTLGIVGPEGVEALEKRWSEAIEKMAGDDDDDADAPSSDPTPAA